MAPRRTDRTPPCCAIIVVSTSADSNLAYDSIPANLVGLSNPSHVLEWQPYYALIISDTGNNILRGITNSSTAYLVAGNTLASCSLMYAVPLLATKTCLSSPQGLAAIGSSLFIVETGAHRVRTCLPAPWPCK